MSSTNPSGPSGVTVGLDLLARRTLEFEGQWFKYPGAKESMILERFGESPTRYYQRLNALLDCPAAVAEFPMVVHRLRRLRDLRRGARRPDRHGVG